MVKKIISAGMIAVITLFGATIVRAQTASSTSVAKTMTDNLRYLHLTETQVNKVLYVNKVASEAFDALDNKIIGHSDTIDSKSIADQFVGILAQRDKSLSAILTSEQMSVLKQNRVEEMASFRTFVMIPMLDLTERQTQKVYDINVKGAEAVSKVFGKHIGKKYITPETADSKKASDIISGNMNALNKDFKKILSPEQFKTYKNNQKLIKELLKTSLSI
ncbi:hypothetical protein [Chryseobacterium daeguense]|uniref:hypothetical protein n=1 Tax=Chryseobacterium daeguense TaxID=412438 RepID=UPI000416301B|nr:hypothetical protein [Chryseobacterium daeguense]